jgi:hypothetical protein
MAHGARSSSPRGAELYKLAIKELHVQNNQKRRVDIPNPTKNVVQTFSLKKATAFS